jgi:hypothetical protein
MEKDKVFQIVKDLAIGQEKTIFENENYRIWIHRPPKLSKRFANYDISKNFQIWLRDGTREFRPNHLRMLIDLNLRVRSRTDLKKKLLLAFDNIFYGKDPEVEIRDLAHEKFEHFLNPIIIIAILAQLFHIEQEYGYTRESKFEPQNLFLQGWIREFIDNPKEIDNLCMSVAKGQPPTAKYTNAENRKHPKYDSSHSKLWYIQE